MRCKFCAATVDLVTLRSGTVGNICAPCRAWQIQVAHAKRSGRTAPPRPPRVLPNRKPHPTQPATRDAVLAAVTAADASGRSLVETLREAGIIR